MDSMRRVLRWVLPLLVAVGGVFWNAVLPSWSWSHNLGWVLFPGLMLIYFGELRSSPPDAEITAVVFKVLGWVLLLASFLPRLLIKTPS
jgi:hypothetical protein